MHLLKPTCLLILSLVVCTNASADYWTRVKFISHAINPLNLMVTKEHVMELDKTNPTDMRSRALLAARLHPDTKELIPAVLSLPAIIPVNLLIVAGMLNARSSASMLAWQVINQSANTGVNWANGNKSGPNKLSMNELMMSYAVSVLASCSLSLAVKQIALKRKSAWLTHLTPLLAVGGANCVNVGVMRGREWFEGIKIYDDDMAEVGVSRQAAKSAILHTIISRNAIAAALLMVPPVTMVQLTKVMSMSTPMRRQLTELLVILGCMVPAVPMGVALYPQQERMSVEKVEEPLRTTLRAKGITQVTYNRGL